MKKTLYVIMLVVIVLTIPFVVCSCGYDASPSADNSDLGENDTDTNLIIDGKKISSKNISILEGDAHLPLTEVLKGLGYDINWVNDNTANVTRDNAKYILTIDGEASLIIENNDFNLITPPPGTTTYYCKVIEKDVLLDSLTVECVLLFMNDSVRIKVDNENEIVYIDTKK